MSGTITTGGFPAALWQGVHDWFGSSYKQHPEEWRDIFTVETSEKAYEEDNELPGFGRVPLKAEGASIEYDTHSQGWTKRYTHATYAMGFVVTEEAESDNQYKEIAMKRAAALARSVAITKNILGANVINRAHNSSYVGGDSVELCSTSHTTLSGNQSNALAVAAPLSESSLEDLITQIRKAKDTRGNQMQLMPKTLLIPVDLAFEADRILKSQRQSGTANNDVNALNTVGLKIAINHFLTDTNAWGVITDCPSGLTWFDRWPNRFQKDSDFETSNKKHKASFRVSAGWTDWRSYYGTDGGS